MATPSTAMARRLEMWRGACAGVAGQSDEMIVHYERAAELAGSKNPAAKAEAHCSLAVDAVKTWAVTADAALLERARTAAEQTLDVSSGLPEACPWGPVAHAVLAVVDESEGRAEEAADHARTALSTLDGLTHILHFVNVLWAAGRVLIGQQAPEAGALIQQVAQGLGFVSMNIVDGDIRAKWFAVEFHRELAVLVGFQLSDAFGSDGETVDLAARELEVLRDLTSGSDEQSATSDEISSLLEKLGVESETEAIEYAIKADVTWK